MATSPNPRLQRTPLAPLSRKPLGAVGASLWAPRQLMIAFLAAVAASALLPAGADGSSPGGQIGGMTVPVALDQADVVAFMTIDAGQLSPPIFHAHVTDPVKGIEKGAELCFIAAHPTVLRIGVEHLAFLFRGRVPPTLERSQVCQATAPVLVQADAPDPLAVVTTFELAPCTTAPCGRTEKCTTPPCFRPAEAVRMSATGFPALRPVPVICPQSNGDTWVFRGSLLVALKDRLRGR